MNNKIHHDSGALSTDFTELGADGGFEVPEFLKNQDGAKKVSRSHSRKVARERKKLERQQRRDQKELSIAQRIQEEWRLPRKKLKPMHFLATAVVVLALAFLVGEEVYNKYFTKTERGLVAAAYAGVPEVSEEPISNQSKMDYKVPRSDPRYLRIGALGIDARVQSVGRDRNGQIAVANNIFDAAWFNESVRPGENGAVVVNGHISGPTQDGIFAKVAHLKKGDEIVIERGDTMKFTYKVEKVETVRLEDVNPSKLFQVIDGKSQGLNLITCAGQYDRGADSYSDRTIVYTTFVKKN